MDKKLIPVEGAWVQRGDNITPGRVVGARRNGDDTEVGVKWYRSTQTDWVPVGKLRCGFKLNMEVQDIPRSRTRKPLGEGVVLEIRSIGAREQVLVEFPESGQRIWLPYENLKQIKGPRHRFVLGQVGDPGNAERFRLRSLAYAIDMWNENTGSLSRLDIDPLPHQIHLVHHILASGNLNWLIADDVGLGKTIEVGMLLAALEYRGLFRRILLVTPAGLVRQWQEELHHKFGMSDFQIYGKDFEINDPRHWKLHDHVIGSIDRFKSESHLEKLLQAGNWDLIVFDEAHRLSRRQWGGKYDASERYKLAAKLRSLTDAFILLSATPHQGMQDKFQALLDLLRPELSDEIRTLDLNPEIIRDMVIRNHKADVTDAAGNFIFHGKTVRAIQVPVEEVEREFDRTLQRYIREGYESSRRRGRMGIPIGFVMMIYRKLAASSIEAIKAALARRLGRLQGDREILLADGELDDERYSGEQDELRLEHEASADDEFFAGEMTMLKALIDKAEQVAVNDRKMAAFIDDLVRSIHAISGDERLLVFTEYRATQDYLARELRQRFGDGSVSLINGGMKWEEREEAIAHFEDEGKFLISTEAGGEGLNLHRRCHIMVNYDLPWNPMRLVQRIGRLYRYGQQHNVVVLNMHAPQTVDAEIMNLMYSRIDSVVHDMATISQEFRAGLEDEILGELAEMLDIEKILEEAATHGIQRTSERIDEALQLARDAVEKQRELFEYVTGYDPNETSNELQITPMHVLAFVEGMLRLHEVEIVNTTHKGQVLDIKLTERLLEELHTGRQRLRITFNREIASTRADIEMMDFNSPLFRWFMEEARSYKFDGICAALDGLEWRSVMGAILRWQNDQGLRMRQEYTVIATDSTNTAISNPKAFSDWLLKPVADGSGAIERDHAKNIVENVEKVLDYRLAEVSNYSLHPENKQLVAAAWCASDRA